MPPLHERLLNFEPDRQLRKITDEERALVQRCMDIIEARELNLKRKGLDTPHFMFGVTNSLFVAWSFAAIPGNFWLVYLVEAIILLPLRWLHQVHAHPLKQHYYWLDFCWISNFTGALVAIALVTIALLTNPMNVVDDWTRHKMFGAMWGVSCGPLLLATGLLGNALVFHDVDNTASVLIHVFPSLVMHTMRWNAEMVHAAWPSVFHLHQLDTMDIWADVYRPAAAFYMGWLVMYTVWLLSLGMSAPSRGYDTVFHANMQGSIGSVISRKLGQTAEERAERIDANMFSRKEAMFYMMGHAVASLSAILVSLLCFKSKACHSLLCIAMVFLTIYNGASRYSFYMIHANSRTLRKEFGIPLGRKATAVEFLPSM